MKHLFLPKDYTSKLDVWETEHAIKFVKDTFQLQLAASLQLRRITAPIAVQSGKGLNDNLSGVETPVTFPVVALDGENAEIVQSLAKWKRYALWRHKIEPGIGIYTDMNAIRPHETPDNIHSVYVDQWDWEKVMGAGERTPSYLYKTVQGIYQSLKKTEFLLSERYPQLKPFLPEDIHFIHTEELRALYPTLTSKERERMITKEYGAVFIIGIGGELGDGKIHDDRSPDYDDWSTPLVEDKGCELYKKCSVEQTKDSISALCGLNGDILVWNPVLEDSFEISSMGIRVDPIALTNQLELRGEQKRRQLYFHSLLLDGSLPQTIGGGIGQSRLCMLLLQKCHIGEVQSGLWPKEMLEECEKAGVFIF